jgi:uncharacterized membrane protein (DUF2068 family)
MVRIDIRRLAFWFLIITVLLFVAVRAAQADELVQVALTADREELTVGDPVQLSLEVTHPAGYQVIIPKLEHMWGEFEVLSQSQASTSANDDGTETTRQIIEVTLFNLGEFETAPLPLTTSDGAGQVIEEVVPAVTLAVNPTLSEEDNNLRDIKPQAGLAVPPLWPWILGGLLAAALVAVVGWWAYRRWQGKPFGLAPVYNRPPWQVAYDEITRIEGLGLLENQRFKEYYTLVTDCLRKYLEDQFDLRVFDRTTSELKPILRQSDLAAEPIRRLLDLFLESDLVKFAKFTPDRDAAWQLVAEARSIVDLTRPMPEPEAAEKDQPPTPPIPTGQLSYQSRP